MIVTSAGTFSPSISMPSSIVSAREDAPMTMPISVPKAIAIRKLTPTRASVMLKCHNRSPSETCCHRFASTAVGVGSSKNAVPERVYKILEPGLISKNVGEQYLMGSGLAATIVRPGGLDDGPATNDFALIEDPTGPFDRVDRAEVARLTVEALDDDGTIGKIYHVGRP